MMFGKKEMHTKKNNHMSEAKKILRPRTGRVLAGVCAAIANYCKMDVAVVRIICVFLMLFSVFCALPVYFILMLMIPEERFDINKFKSHK